MGCNKMFKLFFGEDQTEKIPKKNKDISKNPGERMYLDISSIRHDSLGGRRHWAMLVDEATRCQHSLFLAKNSDQVDMMSSSLKGFSKNTICM